MRTLANPNTTDKALPVSAEDCARAAKTGCALCSGAGSVVANRPAGDSGPEKAALLCDCVRKIFAKREDIRTHEGVIYWMPPGFADAPATVSP